MPRRQPSLSYQQLRNYTEKFAWTDPKTGQRHKGFNPPPDATEVCRLSFYIKYITQTGKLEEGEAICISVDRLHNQRKIQFVTSQEIRRINDYLVREVDGIRFVTH